MSQCVPSWDLDDTNNPITHHVRLNHQLRFNSNTNPPDVSKLDYEVAELTWENGQLAMHGLGQPRVPVKPFPSAAKYTWEKPRAGGTLESIVDQATSVPKIKQLVPFTFTSGSSEGNDLVPWFDHHRTAAAAAAAASAAAAGGGGGVSGAVTMDALVPCSNRSENGPTMKPLDSVPEFGTYMVGSSTRVGSCSTGVVATQGKNNNLAKKRARMTRVPASAQEWSSRDQSVSGSATFGRDSHQVTVDTLGLSSTSSGSPENTSSDKLCSKTVTADDHDSVCYSKRKREVGNEEDKKKGNNRKSSVSTKRSRAAAIHNQSERKRRDKINQKMKTLQKMVPNSSKTDKASMLDEVIEYLKQLQAQLTMISRMNMSPMMLPLAMQQQLQMSMMSPMGMGMGMGMGMAGMGMDMNTMNTMGIRHNMTGLPPVLHPTAFMPLTSWDGSAGDRLSLPMPDPLSTFAACQSQPMTMDAYSRMAALYQQLHQPPGSSSKS